MYIMLSLGSLSDCICELHMFKIDIYLKNLSLLDMDIVHFNLGVSNHNMAQMKNCQWISNNAF